MIRDSRYYTVLRHKLNSIFLDTNSEKIYFGRIIFIPYFLNAELRIHEHVMIPRDNNLKLPNKDNTTDTCIASFSMPIMMVYPFLLTMKTKCSIPLNCFLGDIRTIDSWFTPLNTIPYSYLNISRYFYSIIYTKDWWYK